MTYKASTSQIGCALEYFSLLLNNLLIMLLKVCSHKVEFADHVCIIDKQIIQCMSCNKVCFVNKEEHVKSKKIEINGSQ